MVLIKSFYKLLLRVALLGGFLTVLAGCGGSSGGGGGADTISGIAATGAAIDGTVNIYGSNGGEILDVPISASGNYSVDVTGLTAPFCICAVPNNSSLTTQYSYAQQPGTANITPLTTLTLFYANGEQDPAGLITTWPTASASVIANAPSAQAAVNANFVSQFSSVDFATYDFLTTAFSIGDTFDQILDLLSIDVTGSAPVITVNGASFAFDPNIDISGINIGGNNGGGSGQLMIAGLTPTSFVPNSVTSLNGVTTWSGNDGVSVVAGVFNGSVVSVVVSQGVNIWSTEQGVSNVPGASFSGSTLTLTDVVLTGVAPQITVTGSISQ